MTDLAVDTTTLDFQLQLLENALKAELSSERASEEVRDALAHIQQARHSLERRDARVQQEQERERLETEAREAGAYDTYEDDPRDDVGASDS